MMLRALVKYSQHVGDQQDEQYGPKTNACSSAGAPARMAVIPEATAKEQYQNDKQYQHFGFSFSEPPLLLEHLLDLTDLILNLARDFFVRTFGFQVRVVRHLAGLLLDLAFGFVEFSLDLILCAFFHGVLSPLVSSSS
jgi:hypothetical protein